MHDTQLGLNPVLAVGADPAGVPQQDLGTVEFQWCLIFNLEEDAVLSDECHELCQRFVAADLVLDASLSSDAKEAVVQVGTPPPSTHPTPRFVVHIDANYTVHWYA